MFENLAALAADAALPASNVAAPARENGVVRLVDFVCRASGYPVPEAAELDEGEWKGMVEFFETVTGYLRNAADDEDVMGLIDPSGSMEVDGTFFEALGKAASMVELFESGRR